MAKEVSTSTVTLGATPVNFKRMTIKVQLPAGGEGELPVDFKYRTKSQYARWLDDSVEKITKAPAATEKAGRVKKDEKEERRFWEAALANDSKVVVAQLLDAVTGWGLPLEFNAENVAQLEDEIPGAALALLGAYGEACRYGRLGN